MTESTGSGNISNPRRMSIWLSIGLSLIVLGIIAAFTIKPDTLSHLRNTHWGLLTLAPVLVVLRVLLGAWRLHYVARGHLRFAGAIRAQLAWDFFSNVTPSTLGGGPIAPAYISRDSQLPLGEATAFMLFAMLLDQIWIAVGIVSVLSASLVMDLVPDSLGIAGSVTFMLYFSGYMAWVAIFAYATLFRPQLLAGLVQKLFSVRGLRRMKDRVTAVMHTLQLRASILRKQQPLFYIKGFLLTVAVWISRYVLVVIILASFYDDLDHVLAFMRTVAMMLGALIMPTPGGAGGIEGLYALLVGPLVPQGLIAPSLLIWRLLAYYVFLAAGAYLTLSQVMKHTPK